MRTAPNQKEHRTTPTPVPADALVKIAEVVAERRICDLSAVAAEFLITRRSAASRLHLTWQQGLIARTSTTKTDPRGQRVIAYHTHDADPEDVTAFINTRLGHVAGTEHLSRAEKIRSTHARKRAEAAAPAAPKEPSLWNVWGSLAGAAYAE